MVNGELEWEFLNSLLILLSTSEKRAIPNISKQFSWVTSPTLLLVLEQWVSKRALFLLKNSSKTGLWAIIFQLLSTISPPTKKDITTEPVASSPSLVLCHTYRKTKLPSTSSQSSSRPPRMTFQTLNSASPKSLLQTDNILILPSLPTNFWPHSRKWPKIVIRMLHGLLRKLSDKSENNNINR